MITKVSDLKYERYTIESGRAAFARFENAAKDAKCADEVLSARDEFIAEMKHYSTATSLCNCRFTLNTRDSFYSAEVDYYDENNPEFSDLLSKYAAIMLDSPFASEMKQKINPRIYQMFEVQRKSFSPVIIEDSKRENALVTEYSKLMSEMKFSFRGKEMPLSTLRGHLSSPDRETRREAAESIGRGLMENSTELDRIFDELVRVRTEIARKMGYSDFVELGYYRMGRIDYNREMIEKFRENVLSDIVPVVSKIKRGVAKELGISGIMFYDNDTYTGGDSPDPILDMKGILNEAQVMYDKMSPITGEFMKNMMLAEAFDCESRDGKWGGGYCTEFADYKQPFILANFNGTAADIDVITHEFGHALASKFVFDGGDSELGIGGMETAECHSMSMEFLAWPYMESFFGKNADLYKYKHMLDALSFIPYGVIVDEFQHEIYSHPEYSPEERKAIYRKLEEKYRPYMSYEGIPYLDEGTRWQYQMHIYESPFYYIDYCLAQTVAFGFLIKSLENYPEAFQSYLSFTRRGGTVSFQKLIADAGLSSPFESGALSKLAKKLLELQSTLSEKLN